VAAYSALGAAIAAAGVVAGLLAALLAGAGLRWLFVADAMTCLACAAVVRLRLPGGRSQDACARSSRSPWRDRRLRLMMATGTGFAVVYMTMMCGLPLALHRDGSAPGWAGALTALSAVTVIAGQRLSLSTHTDPFLRMRSGYALLGAGLLLAGVATTRGSGAWWYVVPVLVWNLGDAILLGEPLAVVAELAEGAEGVEGADRARYLAAYGVSWGVATTVAAPSATALIALVGTSGLWFACGAGACVLAAVQSRVRAGVTRK
jgi:hypothetical protein